MSKDSGNFEGVLSVRGSNIGNLSFEDDADFTGGIGPACAIQWQSWAALQ